MRNFRKAALASATALAVAFGSTSVAVAQEDPTAQVGTDNTSSQIGAALGVDTSNPDADENFADGTALFGSSKEGFEDQPAWAQVLYGGTIFAAVAGLVGLVFGPLYNFFVHGM